MKNVRINNRAVGGPFASVTLTETAAVSRAGFHTVTLPVEQLWYLRLFRPEDEPGALTVVLSHGATDYLPQAPYLADAVHDVAFRVTAGNFDGVFAWLKSPVGVFAPNVPATFDALAAAVGELPEGLYRRVNRNGEWEEA